MADSRDLGRERSEQLKIEKDLLALQAKRKKAGEDLNASELQSLVNARNQLKAINRLIDAEKKRNSAASDGYKEFQSFANEFRRLSPSVKAQLKNNKDNVNVYANLATQAAKQAEIESKNSGVVSQNARERKEALRNAKDALVQSATSAAQEMDNLMGISEFERQRLDLEAQRSILGNDTVNALQAASLETEQLVMKTEMLKDLNQQLPGPVQSMLGFARKLRMAFAAGMGPLFLIAGLAAAALISFTKLDDAAKSFRETTGLTNSQMEGIKSQANEITGQFAYMGVNAEKVFDTAAALTSEFTDFARFSNEAVAGLTLLNTNFGVSADSAAKVQGIFEQIGGLSSDTAAGVQLQVAEMAKLAGVAPAKVFEDIAENAEIASTLFQGDVESLTKAAIQARQLGTNLKSVAATTEHLLDFQSNIGDELVAATFVGGQFNLTQARSLAAAGKTVEAQKEVLRQLNRAGDFRKQDYFTQRQLAKAAGMSVEEINKQLNAQEKLNSLNAEQRALADKAIEQGLDISNIDKDQLASKVAQFSQQQEMQGQVEAMGNAFTGIAGILGTALVPLLQSMFDILNPVFQVVGGIFGFLNSIPGVLPAIIAGLTAMYIISKRAAIQSTITAIATTFKSLAEIPFGIGIPLAAAAIGGLLALISKAKGATQVGDLAINPNGGPIMMSPKEGGLFQGSKNDAGILAPPSALGGGGTSLNNELITTPNIGAGGTPAWAERLIAATEKTKDVYMDGRRVTANVARSVDKSTKNNFSFGT